MRNTMTSRRFLPKTDIQGPDKYAVVQLSGAMAGGAAILKVSAPPAIGHARSCGD